MPVEVASGLHRWITSGSGQLRTHDTGVTSDLSGLTSSHVKKSIQYLRTAVTPGAYHFQEPKLEATALREYPQALRDDCVDRTTILWTLTHTTGTARCALVSLERGWRSLLIIGRNALQTERCLSQEQVLATADSWRLRLIALGWREIAAPPDSSSVSSSVEVAGVE
jgi:hypothetical protein